MFDLSFLRGLDAGKIISLPGGDTVAPGLNGNARHRIQRLIADGCNSNNPSDSKIHIPNCSGGKLE